ncbi:MAG TPA: hypothetical protein VKP88_06590 [Candidatus Paceibacterota bacterium]|nr:hypothetical protein [Candidatus Paceibacterota bacterium]
MWDSVSRLVRAAHKTELSEEGSDDLTIIELFCPPKAELKTEMGRDSFRAILPICARLRAEVLKKARERMPRGRKRMPRGRKRM